MSQSSPSRKNAWKWIPSLYYAEGLPYIVVMTVSVIMYKRLGISNTDIALYTSWLYLPWVIKPFWSPAVDILRTKRWWIVTMQLVLGAGFAGVAFTIPVDSFFQYTLAFLWLLAFSSATHDIAADGFYMLGLDEHDQAWFVGIRSTFYRLAMLTGQGLLVILAGFIEEHSGLHSVDVQVTVQPAYQQEQMLSPDSLPAMPAISTQAIVVARNTLTMNTAPLTKSVHDSLIKATHQWNLEHAHIAAENWSDRAQKGAGTDDTGIWTKYVSKPLGKTLRAWFGDARLNARPNYTGNVTRLAIYLAQPPEEGQTVVVNMGRVHGDKSIALIGPTRFEFNASNWNKPALALIQLDPKLRENATATFRLQSGNVKLSWVVTFFLLAGLFILFSFYHRWALPRVESASETPPLGEIIREFFNTFILFFKKKDIGRILLFLMLYRFAEAQLVKLASPFLLDAQEAGGLALTTGQVGIVYGTVGLLALTIGGLAGGFVAARDGLKYWLFPMAIAINLPDVVYVVLAYTQTDSLFWINVAVAIEQLGYGFGFTAYMLYMIYVSESGSHKTAHFAITTGFMALGMMIPGMFSGWLQEHIGYPHFFVWVILSTIPAIWVTRFVNVDADFGKKKSS